MQVEPLLGFDLVAKGGGGNSTGVDSGVDWEHWGGQISRVLIFVPEPSVHKRGGKNIFH